MARLEKRTGGAGIASDLVLRGLGGDLLGAKVLNRGLEVDVEGGGRGLADSYLVSFTNPLAAGSGLVERTPKKVRF